MPTPPAVVLDDVVKRFGALTAVDHVALEVPVGTCFGLLGPNGAGKSTTMRLLTGQAVADSGEVRLLGHRLPRDSKAARARCGVVPQVDNLDDELTVTENLAVYARLYGVPRDQRAAAVSRGLDRARLADRAGTLTDTLSGGMRRRLLISRGLVHDPELVLLDEPTVGLDPQIRQQLWTQIAAIRGSGATVVMTTHYIEEAERLCDEVAIIHAGRLVARGRPDVLIARHVGRDVVEVPGDARRLARAEEQARAAGFVTRRAGTTVAVLGAEGLDRRTDGGAPATTAAINGAGMFDGEPAGRRRAATLEDVFVVLTGEELV